MSQTNGGIESFFTDADFDEFIQDLNKEDTLSKSQSLRRLPNLIRDHQFTNSSMDKLLRFYVDILGGLYRKKSECAKFPDPSLPPIPLGIVNAESILLCIFAMKFSFESNSEHRNCLRRHWPGIQPPIVFMYRNWLQTNQLGGMQMHYLRAIGNALAGVAWSLDFSPPEFRGLKEAYSALMAGVWAKSVSGQPSALTLALAHHNLDPTAQLRQKVIQECGGDAQMVQAALTNYKNIIDQPEWGIRVIALEALAEFIHSLKDNEALRLALIRQEWSEYLWHTLEAFRAERLYSRGDREVGVFNKCILWYRQALREDGVAFVKPDLLQLLAECSSVPGAPDVGKTVDEFVAQALPPCLVYESNILTVMDDLLIAAANRDLEQRIERSDQSGWKELASVVLERSALFRYFVKVRQLAGFLVRQCATCGITGTKDALRVCARCKKAAYCTARCQEAAWPVHKKACARKHLDAAFAERRNLDLEFIRFLACADIERHLPGLHTMALQEGSASLDGFAVELDYRQHPPMMELKRASSFEDSSMRLTSEALRLVQEGEAMLVVGKCLAEPDQKERPASPKEFYTCFRIQPPIFGAPNPHAPTDGPASNTQEQEAVCTRSNAVDKMTAMLPFPNTSDWIFYESEDSDIQEYVTDELTSAAEKVAKSMTVADLVDFVLQTRNTPQDH